MVAFPWKRDRERERGYEWSTAFLLLAGEEDRACRLERLERLEWGLWGIACAAII
jgi:hypothetical protein